MQLKLNFSEIEPEKVTNKGHCEDSYIQEFEQGNFSHVLRQTKYSAKEIFILFLQSEKGNHTVKASYLKYMGNRIDNLAWFMDEKYKIYVRSHNDMVRKRITENFYREDPLDLSKRGLYYITNYNNYYREMYGGKSFSKISVEDSTHERHEAYLAKRKEHIKECFSMLKQAVLIGKDIATGKETIARYYIDIFGDEDMCEVIQELDLSEGDKAFILELIKKKK